MCNSPAPCDGNEYVSQDSLYTLYFCTGCIAPGRFLQIYYSSFPETIGANVKATAMVHNFLSS